MPAAAVSCSPSWRMKRLPGTHITPPDFAVDPPAQAVFSRITTDFPACRMTSAELIEPPPLPTTTQSNTSSKPMPPSISVLADIPSGEQRLGYVAFDRLGDGGGGGGALQEK